MYKIFFLVLFFVLSITTYSQKIKSKDVPPKIVASLAKNFKDSKKENWEFVEDRYQATFEVYGMKGSASFSEKGKILNSEIEVSNDDLPFSIGYYVKKNHDNEKILKASKLKDSAGLVTYQIVIPDFMLTFNAAGEFLKEVSTVEEVSEEATEIKSEN